MGHRFAEIAFTDAVKRVQAERGSRRGYARLEAAAEPRNAVLGPDEADFIAARDSFYMVTVSETGWPYVQHRGGPTGFLRVPTRARSASPIFPATGNTLASAISAPTTGCRCS